MTTIREKFNQEIERTAEYIGLTEEELMKDEPVEQLYVWFRAGYETAMKDVQKKLERNCCDQCLDKLFNPKQTYTDDTYSMQLSPVLPEEMEGLPED